MVEVIRRGEIWTANLNPPRGQEIGKIRPVLVFQDNALTAIGAPMVIILPLTTQVYPAFKQWRITVTARHRLLKDCQIVVDQPRTLDRSRFGEGPLATLSEEEMISVERAFLGICGMFHYAICSRQER
ncbi:type II toxin-antitoxin system PemK/MazF family toxin [Nitrosomonas sp. Is35]|uniref:type II toxin-antitoxin system PemK/MazF family toxin n=1 Tax=Nitrosomonas sp. Is35 TaxID=3080534 RepID=UPI00294B4ED6|nr:type II toxin-antitoxin system PemK/MazF family toxin [Nitrosomonas sp. Is35]MDV6346101.1 type II toxin-antitoxin system PemK/MazF family toxin [Nitrosomonas sp. Is35]